MTDTLIEQVSVTETEGFRRCRRRWYLGQVAGYQRRTEAVELWFGDLMHDALQVLVAKDLEAAKKHFRIRYKNSLKDLEELYGHALWEGARELYEPYLTMGQRMLENYVKFTSTSGLELEHVQLEQRVWVPILDPKGNEVGTKLTARMDRIVAVKGQEDLYILDYKTGSSASTGKSFELNDQVTGYCYVYYRLQHELPNGVIFEHLLKRVDEEPRMIRGGSQLSTAKNQNTLPDAYWAKMKELGLLKSAEHLECYNALVSQGWDGYIERELTQRNVHQVLAYEQHLYYIWKDMIACVKNPKKAYPNPSKFNCEKCPFLTPCLMMEDGSDAESYFEENYVVNKEKRW